MDGIEKVTKGFHGGKEINTVTFDASQVTQEKMINTLKEAGTYIGTADKMDE